AIAGCPSCLQSHEAKLLETGLSEAAVHDLLRIAAIVNGASIALSVVQ
ncbi:MAG: carboxymuconolactone decarboxylase family protein, partial [Planctomycetaceae bacterium]|nr:carboxymuconolactone decarboxylase family protein [Planctomycetales bacterium]MBL9090744.1 carboxymuconolactone decarboxylase family protein [Planctomycetaceae bacterium]